MKPLPSRVSRAVLPVVMGVLLGACAASQHGADEPRGTTALQPSDTALSDRAAARTDDAAEVATSVAPEPASPAVLAGQVRSSVERFVAPLPPAHCCVVLPPVTDAERYGPLAHNPAQRAAEQPVSTFAIDVDTGAYSNLRRFLTAGRLPPPEAVRVEEMLNYFAYSDPAPASREQPFRVTTELAATPWNAESLLLRIGIQGYDVPAAARPAANLVFLIDVSGSMQSADKLPLLKSAFRLLARQLTGRDRVSIVVYAGASGVVLPPTRGGESARILDAIGQLEAGGSTNGGDGIRLAYRLARDAYIPGGINRVLLATDGDFNVGMTDFAALVALAARERASGVQLSTLGFGTGNYNDHLLEQLADAGNGHYAYIDTLAEARKVLVDSVTATLLTIARDVKVQVEFNPATVAEYRLIGYENRALRREDFANDRVDAGDIGAGHHVTALYEVVPAGRRGHLEPLRYGRDTGAVAAGPEADRDELAFVRLRYQSPDVRAAGAPSRLIELPVRAAERRPAGRESTDFRLAAGVAAFGQLLTGSPHLGSAFGYEDVRTLLRSAQAGRDADARRELLTLVDLAAALAGTGASFPEVAPAGPHGPLRPALAIE